MMRTEAAEELAERSMKASHLAGIIARRARYAEGFNRHDLKPGEAFIGDCRRCGMTRQQYRTAIEQLQEWGFATFRPTNKGTIAKLTDTRLFDVTNQLTNQQDNQQTNQPGNQQGNQRVTTNYKEQEGSQGPDRSKRKKQTPADAAVIESIYEQYPRKEAKQAALKAIANALKKLPADQLLAKTKAYAEFCRTTGKELRYTPLAASWYNGERWADSLIEPAPQPTRPGQPAPKYDNQDWRSAL
jgi:hypothetical protein